MFLKRWWLSEIKWDSVQYTVAAITIIMVIITISEEWIHELSEWGICGQAAWCKPAFLHITQTHIP